ncbi:complement resistance protein TraT [Myxococcus sp. RHSTA-1-4]|uniref:complement resistance protein TraT n=1 Tax=Myxococcus sp. RHSTA-1-4 TaxID=2874601 RepID=UPI001CC17B27|nr:complement resistance protein TraT [Myxococcus sp. RHSTA-1-4]MBZ4419834.1 complement resistance protein TraT [Myxococcus sp. RHSTA-1-4]
MNLIEPCMLAGAAVGAVMGAVLGFASGPLWGTGGLLVGAVLGGLAGPFVFIFLGLLFLTVRFGPRHVLSLFREGPGTRRPPGDA